MSTLEDRYRRLLAWYPADHRSTHEQEMLGVLLAGARPGRTRPSIADTFDLLRGAARVHLPGSWPLSCWSRTAFDSP